MYVSWFLLAAAIFFELIWVVGLKHADNVFSWALTIIAIIVSTGLLTYTGKKLPTSTVYSIFVGVGTAGTVVIEMAWFGAPFSWEKICLIGTLLIGVIGLNIVTPEPSEPDQDIKDISVNH
ncbi:DMT family transporter [Siminovitchia sediminis]|uniref:DMT family transporter n=1 Tax=Siminovitchia sediminis TaxID=1274353 RepID=A0ABW4KK11_9BACI